MALSWSDISSQAWFTELAPEQKAKALDVWTQDTLSSVTDPAEREQLEAASEFGKLKYLGQPLPAQSLEEFVPIFQEQKRLKAADEQGLLTQLGGALQTGFRDVTTGLGVTFDALTGDNAELAQGLAAMNETDAVRQQNKTTQDIQFEKALAENAQQFKDAKGFWPTTKELADYVGITLSNPTAFAKMVAESAPNALVSIGAQAVGAGVGALAAGVGGGAATGGAGAIPAAFAGGGLGAVAANVPLEIPSSIRQKFLEVTKGEGAKMTPEQIKQVLDANPEIVSEGALKGTVRGTAIGVVEGLTAGVAGKVVTIPERAAERAVLAETARRMGQATATRLEAADYIFKTPGAKQAMAEVASKALSDFTVGQRVAGLAGAGLIETAGEGAGELAAQVATGEEIDPTAIYQEVAAGLGMAGASTALARSMEPARQIVQRINASPELQAEKQNLTAAENLVQQAAADPNTVASVAAAKAVINQGDQNLVEKAATAVAQEFQVSPDITSGITDLGEAEGDIRTSIPLQTPQGAELPATEAALAGQPFATETPFRPTDLESGLTEVPPISPADITAGLEPQPPTQTTEDAALQGQVPENRIEERVQADEGGPTAETGGGNRPVIGGQVQAEVQTDEVTIPPQGVVPTESLPEGQVTPGGAAVPSVKKSTVKKFRNSLGLPWVGDLLDSIQSKIVIPAKKDRRGKGEYDELLLSLDPKERSKVFKVAAPGQSVINAYTIDSAADDLGYQGDVDRFVRDVVEALANRKRMKSVEKAQQASEEAAVKQLDLFKADIRKGDIPVNLDDLSPGSKVTVQGTVLEVDNVMTDEDGRATFVRFAPSTKYGRQEVAPEDNLTADAVQNPEVQDTGFLPAEELPLGPTESVRPPVRGETAKPQVEAPLVELQQAIAESEAARAQGQLPMEKALTDKQRTRAQRKQATAEELKQLEARKADALARFRKSLGQTNVGFNPETFAIALELADISIRTGAVKFADFAQDMKDSFPDLWDRIKNELSTVWTRATVDNPDLEETPRRSEVADILRQLDAQDIQAEQEPDSPVESTAPVEPIDARVKIGFGQRADKTVQQLLDAGDSNYLFRTLFDDKQVGQAPVEQLVKIREIVKSTPEYQRYAANENKTPEQLKTERESNQAGFDTTLANLKNAGINEVAVGRDGAIEVKLPANSSLKGKLVSNGFYYDPKKGAYVTKDYAAAQEVAEKLASQDERAFERQTSTFKIRNEIRAELEQADDESEKKIKFSIRAIPSPSPLVRQTMEFFQNSVRKGRVTLQTAVNQLTDALLISSAKKDGKPMFLLGSQAGYGKTFVLGASLAEMTERGAINDGSRIIYFTKNQALIAQAKKDMKGLFDPARIQFKTYSNLDSMEENDFQDSDVLIFDEAHEIRYGQEGLASTRAKQAEKMLKRASFTVFASATPYESIEQMRFLWPTGVFKELEGKFMPASEDSEMGWFDFATAAGGEVKTRNGVPSSVEFKAEGEDLASDQRFAREFLRKKGMFSFRPSDIPQGMVGANFAEVAADPYWKDISNKVLQAFEAVGATAGNDRAYLVNFLKRILEAAKLPSAIGLAKAKLEANPDSRVVVFTETRSEADRQLAEMSALAQQLRENEDATIPEGFPQLPKVINALAYLYDRLGVKNIAFPSVQQVFQESFGKDNVVFYTGNESGSKRASNKSNWEKGQPRLIVATMAAGGTGLSLHDTSEGGKFPRVQINVNLPWRASDLEQVTRRTARSGMTSPTDINWLFADSMLNEKRLASVVAGRLDSMSALVTGKPSEEAITIGNYDWNPLTGTATEEKGNALNEATNSEISDAMASFLTADIPEGEVTGSVSKQDFEAGMKIVEGLIRNARVLVVSDTRENLLKRDDIEESVKELIRKGAQGAYVNGRAVVVRDGIKATTYTATPAQAAAAVIFHEIMHNGMDILRSDPQFAPMYQEWLGMVRDNVTVDMLDNLVRRSGYGMYSDWRENPINRVKAEEEVFVRQLEGLYNRKGDLPFKQENLLRRFQSWLKRLLEKVFGTPIEGRIADDILASWGRKIINAVQVSHFKDLSEPMPFFGEMDNVATQRRGKDRISTFSEEEIQSVEEFMQKNPDFNKIKQFLGLEKGGEMGRVEALDPLKLRAVATIGFEEDDAGAPIVTPEATASAKSIVSRLLDPASGFAREYNQGADVDTASTAVLQLELLRYGLALARAGDSSLLIALRQNWNGVVLGAYVTATSAGRILNARRHYVSNVMQTLDQMDKEMAAQAAVHITKLGVSEDGAKSFVESLQKAVEQVQYDEEQKRRLAGLLSSDPRAKEFEAKVDDFAWISSGVEGLDPEDRNLAAQFFYKIRLIAAAEARLRETTRVGNAAASFLNDINDLPISLPDSEEDLRALIDSTKKEVSEILHKFSQKPQAGAAVRRKGTRTGPSTASKPAPAPAPAPEPAEPVDGTTTGGEADDVALAENVNEATAAASKIIDNLKAFLDKKFTKKAPKVTVYQKIKLLVDRAIKNPADYGFEAFKAEADKDLAEFDIDEEVQEELIAKAFTVFSRYQQKEAERIEAELVKEKAPAESKIPEKAQALRKLVRKYLVNKDRLDAVKFVTQMKAEIAKIGGISEATSQALSNAAYNRFVRNRQAQVARKVEAIKSALLNGSRKTLAKKMLSDKNADALDPSWRQAAMMRLLQNSGLSLLEAQEAYAKFSASDVDLIFDVSAQMAATMSADRANKAIDSLIKQYEKELATPRGQLRQRQESLRALAKAQVRVPLERDIFRAEAARFGATQAQADRLFNLAKVEGDLLLAENGRTPTKLRKLVEYVLSRPQLANNPAARSVAIDEFLRDNGYSDAQIASSKSWIEQEFSSFIKKAKVDSLNRAVEAKKRAVRAAETRKEKKPTITNPFMVSGEAAQILQKDLESIRKGLGSYEIDPQQTLAAAMGYSGFRQEDYKSLAELDNKITRAIEDGRQHDVSLGLKELYELLSRRRTPRSFGHVLAVSYISSALGGLGTLAVNFLNPAGSFINRVVFDLGRAVLRGNFAEAANIGQYAVEALKRIRKEAEFGLLSGASNVAMNNVVFEVTTLQGEVNAAREKLKDKKSSLADKLRARYTLVASWTGIISRVLMAADHIWSSVMQNYFIKVESMKAIGDPKTFVPLVAGVQNQESQFLNFNLLTIDQFADTLEQLRQNGNINKASLMKLVDEIVIEENTPAENRVFLEDFKGDLRRVVEAYLQPESWMKNLRKLLKRSKTNANLRFSDRVNRGIFNAVSQRVSPEAAQSMLDYTKKETEYEMGTHRGEESPIYDVVNAAANMVRKVGQSVKSDNPILGTMIFGFFGIPVNLFNRSLWLSPYGLVRYAIQQGSLLAPFRAPKVKPGADKYYQQSMQTVAQMRQRLIEAWVGTAAIGLMLALKEIDDDDEEGFNVTLAGPSNKTEQDAWRKQGHRQGALEYVTSEGRVVSLNWARGVLEPWKIAFLAIGALDDMRLNRKLGDENLPSSFSDYFSALAYGWSKQAAFFGVKNTVGAVLSVDPEANIAGNLLYKLNPFFPFSGTIKSMENMIIGPDRFRGREGAIWLNLPLARSLLTDRAVNALGDPQGYVPSSAWSSANDRAWYQGIPLMVSGKPTGNDERVYDFILRRGTGPGLPQRSALEDKNGLMSDSQWIEYVAARGRIAKGLMVRNLSRLDRLDDDSLTSALSEISSDATRIAKRQFGYK